MLFIQYFREFYIISTQFCEVIHKFEKKAFTFPSVDFMFINNLVTKQQGVITMSFQLSKTYRPERQLITENYRLDEKTAVDNLLKTLDFTQEQ